MTDITFFLTENSAKSSYEITEYNKLLNEFMKDDKLNLLEFTYMKNLEKTYLDTGAINIVNLTWFITLVQKLKDDRLNKVIIKIAPNIFDIISSDNSLVIRSEKILCDLIKTKENNIVFTSDQIHAIEKMFEFMVNKDKRIFGLRGYAGTGKTTLLIEYVSFCLKNRLISSVIFTAPTHVALNIMKSKFKPHLLSLYKNLYESYPDSNMSYEDIIDKLFEKNMKVDFTTIHKLLGYKEDISIEGDIVFIRNGNALMSDYDFVIIDESSMIPLGIVDTIFDELRRCEQKSGDNFKQIPKVLLAGDPAQLPPVNEKTSAVFYTEKTCANLKEYSKLLSVDNQHYSGYNSDEFKVKYDRFISFLFSIEHTTLKEVVRSKMENVTKVCYEIRKWVLGEVDMPNLNKYMKSDGVYFYKNDGQKIKSDWFKKCLNEFMSPKDGISIILTWTNKQSDEYNETIRNAIFKKENLNKYEIGDVIMLANYYSIADTANEQGKKKKKKKINEDDKNNRFYTSEQVKIVNISKIHKDIGSFSLIMNENGRKLKDSAYIDKKRRPIVEKINSNTKRKFMCWKLDVIKSVNGMFNDLDTNINTLYVLDDAEKENLSNEKEYVARQIMSLRSGLLSGLKNKTKQIDMHVIVPLRREWYRLYTEQFASVNYGYSITCHKGQGSSFYNTYIDANDILKNAKEEEMKKCMYTAVTRTSNYLNMLI